MVPHTAQAVSSPHAWSLVMGAASTRTFRPVAPATYELREGGVLRGTLSRYTTQPRIVIGTETWDLTMRRARLGWFVVATREGAPVVDVAYYPRLLAGGTIAFEHQRYRLRRSLLANRWRLRDDDGLSVVTIKVLRPGRGKDRLGQPEFTVEFDAAARARPECLLLLMIAAWSILTRPAIAPAAGGC